MLRYSSNLLQCFHRGPQIIGHRGGRGELLPHVLCRLLLLRVPIGSYQSTFYRGCTGSLTLFCVCGFWCFCVFVGVLVYGNLALFLEVVEVIRTPQLKFCLSWIDIISW